MAREVHIAGLPQMWDGRYLRQRCAWCGAVLIDEDLTLIRVSIPEGKTAEQAYADGDLAPSTWPVNALVARDGHATYLVEAEPSAINPQATKVPEDCCMRLDPAVTR